MKEISEKCVVSYTPSNMCIYYKLNTLEFDNDDDIQSYVVKFKVVKNFKYESIEVRRSRKIRKIND